VEGRVRGVARDRSVDRLRLVDEGAEELVAALDEGEDARAPGAPEPRPRTARAGRPRRRAKLDTNHELLVGNAALLAQIAASIEKIAEKIGV
jgi:hypothetical protein